MKALRLNGRKKITFPKDSRSGFMPEYCHTLWDSLKITIENVERPCPSENEILLSPKYCSLCGTDFSACQYSPNSLSTSFRGPLELPVTLGHEFSAIVANNNGNSRFKNGDIVAVESIISCGNCRSCKLGYRNACNNIELLGLTRDGGLADFVAVPYDCCWNLREIESIYENRNSLLLAGSTLEIFGCAYHALFCCQNSFFPGCTICIHGIGALGFAAAYLAAISGAALIILIESENDRINWCKENLDPFSHVIGSSESDLYKLTELIFDATNGYGVDIHIVTTETDKATYSLSIDTLAARGRIVALTRGRLPEGLYLDRLVDKQGGIVGSRGQSGYNIYGHLLALISSRTLKPEKLISNVVSIEMALKLLSESNKNSKFVGRTAVKIDS